MAVRLLSVTPVISTNAYADGNLFFDTTAVTGAFSGAGAGDGGILMSLMLLDEGNQGSAFDLLLLNAATSLGTIKSVTTFTDTLARNLITPPISIATGDWVTGATSGATNKVAGLRNIGCTIWTGSTSLWIAGIIRGSTPTFAAATDLTLRFGIWTDG